MKELPSWGITSTVSIKINLQEILCDLGCIQHIALFQASHIQVHSTSIPSQFFEGSQHVVNQQEGVA